VNCHQNLKSILELEIRVGLSFALNFIGKTSLYNGTRVPKTHVIIETLGSTDELTSTIGVALEYCRLCPPLEVLCEQLVYIQCRLQELNSHIATPDGDTKPSIIFDPDGSHTKQLEEWIDGMDYKLPPLASFILPSGGLESAHLHVSRSVCRRAERSLHGVIEAGGGNSAAGKFLNRLGDFLFTAARFACNQTGKSEVIYKKV
jgi:cob(I)alamin adenosyltransferase